MGSTGMPQSFVGGYSEPIAENGREPLPYIDTNYIRS